MKTKLNRWVESLWPEEHSQLAGPGMKSARPGIKVNSEFELEVLIRLKNIEGKVDSLIEALERTVSKHKDIRQTNNGELK